MSTKERSYLNFGEYHYWSCEDLQMLHNAVSAGKCKNGRKCFMIRTNVFKGYKEGNGLYYHRVQGTR